MAIVTSKNTYKKLKICNTKPIIVLAINNADFKSLKASFLSKINYMAHLCVIED